MYLHLGKNTVVLDRDIVGIFDLETSTVSKTTRDFLSAAEKGKRVVNVSFELPKSFVVAKKDGSDAKIFISQLSTSTLKQRSEKFFNE